MVLLNRNTEMDETMPQTVPSAGFTPPCDYSTFAENFDLSLLPCVSPSTQFYNQVEVEKPKIFASFHQGVKNPELSPDIPKLLLPEDKSVTNIYLEVPQNYPNSPGSLSPYSPHSQGLLSPNDQFSAYRQSEVNYYPSSPELSLYTPSPNSIYSRSPCAGEDYLQNGYKESTSPLPSFSPFQIKEENYLSPCSFSSPTSPGNYTNLSSPEQQINLKSENPDVLLLENNALEKQIKQENTDFSNILQAYNQTDTFRQLIEEDLKKTEHQIVPEKPRDHQLLREVLKDTTFQKKYNIRPFDLGFMNGQDIKMEEQDENVEGDLMRSCNEQLAREPVLNMVIEEVRKDVGRTCAALGISPDPQKWSTANVLSWLKWTSSQSNLPEPSVDQWDISGFDLVNMPEAEFTRRSPQAGEILHAQLEIWKAAYSEETWLPETASSNASSGDMSDGNLELLSPEERKHFKKRKEYLQLDDERNIYNSITDMYNVRDTEDMITKKHKYRKKRHGETELGMGNSTEMMIPKEKPKRRKKKRENSPGCTNGKRKHKKRDDEYEVKNDITLALEELQDDVFENNHDEIFPKPERIKRSPRRADKVYVQKKNKFEYVGKQTNNNCIKDCEEGPNAKELSTYHPLQVAIVLQSWWIRISNVCHGLLGGLALGHWLYLICNINSEDNNFLIHYAYYSDMFVALFYGLCVVCIISVLDRIDIEELSGINVGGLLKKKSSFIIIIYITCLILHLSASSLDDKIGNLSNNETMPNMTLSEVKTWNHLSLWRAIFAFTAWIFLGLVPSDDMLYINLKSMERFFPDK